MKKILVAGGAGYIGSYTLVSLFEQGYVPVVLDTLVNRDIKVIERIEQICGVRPEVCIADINDTAAVNRLFVIHRFDAVIHFAGLKAVGESVAKPYLYYQNNVAGSLTLFQVMAQHNCYRLIFSSSATVYGAPDSVPISESAALRATNPYGHSKLMVEQILFDLARANDQWQISLLRYFNPVSAHPSGLIGENPDGVPNNLMPYIAQVGVGRLACLSVYGNDYDTPDGTGLRDYIHVVDLADVHVKALQGLTSGHGCQAYNVGTGRAYSVLEMVQAFERASGHTIPYEIKARRKGDIASCYADPSKAAEELGWRAQYGLSEMMADLWRWQSSNPNGY